MKKILLLLFVCPLFLSAQEKLSENNYRIYSVKLDKEVLLNDIAEEMKIYDVLFFGEEHNDSVGHYLQLELLKRMYKSYGDKISLSMEMFETDCQLVLNEYLQGQIREKNFLKEARAWSNYRDYKPMIEFAREKKMDVIAANAPARYVNLAARKSRNALLELSDFAKSFLPPLPYDTAAGGYYVKLKAVSHMPPAALKDTTKEDTVKMPKVQTFQMPAYGIHSQSLWDATMAYSISQYLKKHKGKKIMQVNGKFHSDEGFAIVTQLRKYSPKTKSLIISTASDDSFPNIEWSTYKKFGDYIIITDPKVQRTFKE
ncbi:MAG: ChaN family lipoprotein [Chitinophagales bacterium]|nr:ChaN family lipoprotein [Chitinophagales bacterium]